MKRLVKWLVLLLVGGAVAWIVIVSFQPEPVLVEVAEVACGPMQLTVDVDGRTRVKERFMISAPVAGKLGRIALKEGDSVKPGDIIARLTPLPSDARTIRANQAASHAADAHRRSAEADFARAATVREQVGRDLDRMEKLAANGIASAHELEQAVLGKANAERVYEAALFASEAAAFQAEEADAALFSAAPDDPFEDALIAQLPVRSPIYGRVLHVVQKSERIVQAGDPLVEIANANALELVFEALSRDAVRIPPGADVLVEQWGGEGILHGTVRGIEPSAFTKLSALGVEEQRVNVIATVVNSEGLLGDGYRVEGRIVIWKGSDVMKVPISALFKTGDVWNVFVSSAGVAVARPIQIGRRNDAEAEVVSGIAENETVILYPNDRINNGVQIRVK